MISHKNSASAVGGKTARACDNCVKKRARWYCVSDDVFLCQSCDASVHSVNPLARRHGRVRLKTVASHGKHLHELMVHAHQMKKSRESNSSPPDTWHKGFVKKPRTPRNKKLSDRSSGNPLPLVPEVGGDETTNEENDRDECLLYRVPAFDQSFASELCNSKDEDLMVRDLISESKAVDSIQEEKGSGVDHLENLQSFLPTDADLAEFEANVESLFGRDLDGESFGIEELGLTECKDGSYDVKECSLSGSGEAVIKLEVEETGIANGVREGEIDMTNETYELSFDCGSPTTCCEDGKRDIELEEVNDMKVVDANKKGKTILSLDYDGVITAWASQGSPWTSGDRPEFNLDNCWQDWMGLCGPEIQNGLSGGLYGVGGHVGIGNAGREAKVSRYREKRRTRLFSKKIRYEVRKLNAEKRPRMKGRFIKRASFAHPTFPSLSK